MGALPIFGFFSLRFGKAALMQDPVLDKGAEEARLLQLGAKLGWRGSPGGEAGPSLRGVVARIPETHPETWC